jgi:hypothetical protein
MLIGLLPSTEASTKTDVVNINTLNTTVKPANHRQTIFNQVHCSFLDIPGHEYGNAR